MPEMLLINPRRRKVTRKKTTARRRPAAKKTRRKVARRRNPSPPGTARKTRRYTRRKNPIVNTRNIQSMAQTAAKGAAGAVALDVALAYLPLPAQLKTGIPGKVTKAAAAIALGILAKQTRMVKDATARDMTVGALTVQFTGMARDLLAQFAPGVALSAYMDDGSYEGLGYAGSGWNPSRALAWGDNGNGMGAYFNEGFPIQAPGDTQPGLDAYEGDSAFGW